MKAETARRAILAAAAGVYVFAIGLAGVEGRPPTEVRPLPREAFSPVVVASLAAPAPSPTVIGDFQRVVGTRPPTRVPRPRVRTAVLTTPRPTHNPAPPASHHSLLGKASWYCRAGVSVCHHSYPDRAGVVDLYAAACASLRRAVPSWRGRRVAVTNLANGRTITVRLIDYCASTDKTVDLYWDAMHALGGSGVIRVRITW